MHDTSTAGGRFDEHLLRLVAAFDADSLNLIDQLLDKLASFLVEISEACLGVNQTLAYNHGSTGIELPHAVVEALLLAGPSVAPLRFHRLGVEAHGSFLCLRPG